MASSLLANSRGGSTASTDFPCSSLVCSSRVEAAELSIFSLLSLLLLCLNSVARPWLRRIRLVRREVPILVERVPRLAAVEQCIPFPERRVRFGDFAYRLLLGLVLPCLFVHRNRLAMSGLRTFELIGPIPDYVRLGFSEFAEHANTRMPRTSEHPNALIPRGAPSRTSRSPPKSRTPLPLPWASHCPGGSMRAAASPLRFRGLPARPTGVL